MQRLAVWLLAIGLLTGCAPSEEEFPSALAEAECAVLVGCYPAAWPTFEACVTERTAAAPPEGAYGSDEAGDCLDELAELECPAGDDAPAWPVSCDAVWSR